MITSKMQQETINFNESEVKEFYTFLGHTQPTEVIVFDKIKYPDGKIVWAKDIDDFVSKVREFNVNQQIDVYVGSRDRVYQGNDGVISSRNIFFEIDEHDIDKPEEYSKVLKFLQDNDIKIGLCGKSGGGYHFYIPHELLEFNDEAYKERYKQGLLNIRTILQKNSIDVDEAVFDLQRVTRVMGTFNWKRGKMTKLIEINYLTKEEKANNRERLASLSEQLGLLTKEIQIENQSALEILDKYNIKNKDTWLYDLISKGKKVTEDTGGNSVVFKNTAIILLREEMSKEEIRTIGKAVADLCEGRTLSAFYGWITGGSSNKYGEVNRTEIDNFIVRNHYELTKYSDMPKQETIFEKKIDEAEPLELMTISDLRKHKVSKEYLIKGIKYPKQNDMIVAPSRSGKSILSLYQAVCIASGRNYLGKFKTKKSPVLVVLAETHKDWLQEVFLKIMRGLKLRSSKIPIHFLTRDKCEDLLNPIFMAKLCKTIKQYNVKVIYFDTINPLTPSLDDNSARDVTRLFNEFLKPVVDLYGCNITYLHHTDKKGSDYLGSMKWFANSDQVFRFDRKELSPQVTIFNEKSRKGESNTLVIEWNFTDKDIKIKLVAEKEPSVFNKKRRMTQQEFFILKLKEFFSDKEDITRAEAMQVFKENKIKFTTPTFDRAWKEWRKE